MTPIINALNVVIGELNLIAARIANGEAKADITSAVIKAQNDLQAVLDRITAQGSGGDENPSS